MFYLYLKTHNITGMKYLGKTSSDPFKYKGSGKYWVNHLRKHGNDVSTVILAERETNDEIKEIGLKYSIEWDIVKSPFFANLKEESGDGGSYPHREETKRKISEAHKRNQKAGPSCKFRIDVDNKRIGK